MTGAALARRGGGAEARRRVDKAGRRAWILRLFTVLALLLALLAAGPARALENLNEAYLPYLGPLPAHEQRWFEAAFTLYR